MCKSPRQHNKNGGLGLLTMGDTVGSSTSSGIGSGSDSGDMNDLLLQLQDEFGQMSLWVHESIYFR